MPNTTRRRVSRMLAQAEHTPQPGLAAVAWDILIRPDAATLDQAVIGVAYQTPDHIYHRLVDAAQWDVARTMYNEATIEQFRLLTQLVDHALLAQQTSSPAPGNVIYGPRYRCNYPTPQQALDRLFALRVNALHGLDRPARMGGDHPNIDNAEARHRIIQQLRDRYHATATSIIQQRRRRDDPAEGPLFASDGRIADVIAVDLAGNPYDCERQIMHLAVDLSSIRTAEQRAALFILTQDTAASSPEAQQHTATLLNRVSDRLRGLNVEPLTGHSTEQLVDQIAAWFNAAG